MSEKTTPCALYPHASPQGGDASSVCHGDDFLAARSENDLDEMPRLHFEVTTVELIGPGGPGHTRYLQRIIGDTDTLLQREGPGFFSMADPKHVDFLIQWTRKREWQSAPILGTKARGHGLRESLELLSIPSATEVAGAGVASLFLSTDRPDTVYASKTAMEHVSKPSVLMNATLRRLGRCYGG